MQLTFEHELVHAIIYCLCSNDHSQNKDYGKWYKGRTDPNSNHNNVFMSIAHNYFNHTKYFHQFKTVKDKGS